MKIKAAGIFAIAAMLLGSHPGRAQNSADLVYIGSSGVARELENPGNAALSGELTAVCAADNAALGGYAGPVTTSTTKGNRGSGYCQSGYTVMGTVQVGQGKKWGCFSKTVERPQGGWNHGIHYAYYDNVAVEGDKVICRMGGG